MDLATKLGMKICTAPLFPKISAELLSLIPYAFVKQRGILPLQEEKNRLIIALSDPLNIEACEDLTLRIGRPVEALYCEVEPLLAALEELYQQKGQSAGDLLADMQEGDSQTHEGNNAIYDLRISSDLPPAIKLVNAILAEATTQGASDIHFEPKENSLRVRYRVDGVLQQRHSPPVELQGQLLTRLKVMAGLDIAEHRLPQDGRIKLNLGHRELDLRVSTLPTTSGERIVLRILDKGTLTLGLGQLGMPEDQLKLLRGLVSLPEGILLVTGPTGSGKTTTLYSALTEIASDETNIMTIEDPVEYKLPKIAQMGVRPKIGLTFASGLRHILRQDPDVIMIGEIRDKETAEIAIQAALTGHFVFSTLHTNDAPSAITRLVEMGIEPYLLSSTIVGIVAQRLVRTLCTACHGQGCSACFQSGYKGRRGIYELLQVTSHLRSQIAQSADAYLLRQLALNEGMESLASCGMRLVEQGITTRVEVMRVTRGVEEVV
ncbi:MAG: type II/IV secretion system protein [Verrucomicrobia bacterium]|nr:type II/IV secretion system protein [Verrucomicrobiota bacterium]